MNSSQLFDLTGHVAVGAGGNSGVGLAATSTLASRQGQPRGQAHAASKVGLIAVIKTIAIELCRHRIRTNAMLPAGSARLSPTPALESEAFQRSVLPRTPVRLRQAVRFRRARGLPRQPGQRLPRPRRHHGQRRERGLLAAVDELGVLA